VISRHAWPAVDTKTTYEAKTQFSSSGIALSETKSLTGVLEITIHILEYSSLKLFSTFAQAWVPNVVAT